jgi:hypothetical protein
MHKFDAGVRLARPQWRTSVPARRFNARHEGGLAYKGGAVRGAWHRDTAARTDQRAAGASDAQART